MSIEAFWRRVCVGIEAYRMLCWRIVGCVGVKGL